MSEQALDNLKGILDRLEPNMWLELDDVSFRRVFGKGFASVEQAAAFATQNNCCLLYDPEEKPFRVRFSRAYAK